MLEQGNIKTTLIGKQVAEKYERSFAMFRAKVYHIFQVVTWLHPYQYKVFLARFI